MLDVKTNVDVLHMSLGLLVTIDSTAGLKTITVNEVTLASTLSLSKGRVLCARAIEDGILPHASACQLLPVALSCILSSSSSSSSTMAATAVDGEDRLLLALTSLIVLTNPVLDPGIFCRCMDVPIALLAGEPITAATKENNDTTNTTSMMMMKKKRDISMIACTRTRVNLLHALLSMGKDVCAKSSYSEEWLQREEIFGSILAAESQK
jgi:hypothetical protein